MRPFSVFPLTGRSLKKPFANYLPTSRVSQCQSSCRFTPECPLYQLFYEGEEPPKLPNLPKRKSSNDVAWGSVGKEARYLNKLRRLLSKSDDTDRKLLLQMAQKMAIRHPRAS
jgi:hypothetical protein